MKKILLVLALCLFAVPVNGHAQERKGDSWMRKSAPVLTDSLSWCRQGALDSPSVPMDASPYGHATHTDALSPFSQRHSDALMSEHHISAPVFGLFRDSGPANIAWRVALGVVDPVYLMLWRRSQANVAQECREVLSPLFRHSDTASAILSIRGVIAVKAAIFHTGPSDPLWRPRCAVTETLTSAHFSSPASATDNGSSNKRVGVGVCCGAALAPTSQLEGLAIWPTSDADNSQAPKLLTNEARDRSHLPNNNIAEVDPNIRNADVFMRFGYVALAGMVVADGTISQNVIDNGGHESAWPYKHFAKSPLKFGLMLGAANGAAGLGAYGLHKRNRVAGRVVMAGLLVAKAFVIKHNYDVAQRQRQQVR